MWINSHSVITETSFLRQRQSLCASVTALTRRGWNETSECVLLFLTAKHQQKILSTLS